MDLNKNQYIRFLAFYNLSFLNPLMLKYIYNRNPFKI